MYENGVFDRIEGIDAKLPEFFPLALRRSRRVDRGFIASIFCWTRSRVRLRYGHDDQTTGNRRPGGRVALQSSELREDESAEVTVIVERAGEASTGRDGRLGALNQLRQALKLPEAEAKLWEAEVRAERRVSRMPAE